MDANKVIYMKEDKDLHFFDNNEDLILELPDVGGGRYLKEGDS